MIGDRISSARINKKLTQQELADLIRVTKQTVSNWETSAVKPSIKTIKKLALELDVSSDYILGIKKKKDLDTEGLDEEAISAVQILIDKIRNK